MGYLNNLFLFLFHHFPLHIYHLPFYLVYSISNKVQYPVFDDKNDMDLKLPYLHHLTNILNHLSAIDEK